MRNKLRTAVSLALAAAWVAARPVFAHCESHRVRGFDWRPVLVHGQRVRTSHARPKAYNRHRRDLIRHDPGAKRSFIVSHELPFDEALDAYRHFDAPGRRLDQGRGIPGGPTGAPR
jgi:hypothetical protein